MFKRCVMARCDSMPDSKQNSANMDLDIYRDDLELYLDEFCTAHGVADPYDMRPQQWTAALLYVHRHTYGVDNSAIRPRGVPGYAYDLQAVNALLDKYIYLCMEHNQRVSINGFSCLSGISVQTIYDWSTGTRQGYIYYSTKDGSRITAGSVMLLKPDEYYKKPTTQGIEIYKKLVTFEGQSLEDSLTDRKKNPMHTLPLFNAFQARHATKQETRRIDSTGIAESLGITADLQALPGK